MVLWADRRFRLGHGRAFALYVLGYTAGRGWIEYLRIDPVQANDVFGLRLNVWTSILVFLGAVGYFIVSARRHPGREDVVFTKPGIDPRADEAPVTAPTPTPPADRGADQGAEGEGVDP